jgi:hypothetical protein
MKISFYNGWHNGDLHVSRTFIKYIMDNFEATSYSYYHSCSTKILQDIDNLKQLPFEELQISSSNKDGYFKRGNNCYINTWYASYNYRYLKGRDLTMFCLYDVFKRTMKELFNHEIPNDIIKFFAKIDYTKYDIKPIDDFILKDSRKKVLICNNNVESAQSINFNFDPIIDELSLLFPDTLFLMTNILTNNILIRPNVIYCSNIVPQVNNNLNEISYLSRFCDIIVGRYSGAQTFSGVYENYIDPSKTFITFLLKETANYVYGDGSFGINQLLPKEKRAKFVCSHDFSEKNIINVIKGELE